MQFHKQLYPHNPDAGIFGDCYRTAIGCLLDLPPEKVPHFYDGLRDEDDATEADKAVRYWLNQQGYDRVTIWFRCEVGEVLAAMKGNNPNIFYLISGTSITGNSHVCVAHGGKIIWDPAKENQGLIGPHSDGLVAVEVLVPLSQSSGCLYRDLRNDASKSETCAGTTPG